MRPNLPPATGKKKGGILSLGEAHLFQRVGSEDPCSKLCQPVGRADRLDLLPNLLRERPKLLGKLKEKHLVSSLGTSHGLLRLLPCLFIARTSRFSLWERSASNSATSQGSN